jgi:uncharacterized delta-60 repeat protein
MTSLLSRIAAAKTRSLHATCVAATCALFGFVAASFVNAQVTIAGVGGEPDRNFGEFTANGQAAVYRFAIGTMTNATAVGVQSSGKPIIAGYCGPNPNEDICVARLRIDGSQLDSSFAGSGFVTLTIAGQDYVRAMAIDAQDRIYLTGYCGGIAPSACVHRFTANGALDTTFGTGGRSGFSGMIEAKSIKIDADGKAVGAGECFAGGTSRMCVARLTETGAMDATFNAGSPLSFLPALSDYAVASHLAFDGNANILTTGYCRVPTVNGGRYRFCAARLTPAGALDTSFAVGGTRSWAMVSADDYAASEQIAIAPDGGVLIAGVCTPQSDSIGRICTTKLTAAGNFDLSYGHGSFAGQSIQVVPNQLYAQSSRLMIDALGRATITSYCNGVGAFCVVRLLANGQADPTFGKNGVRTFQPEANANGNPSFSQASIPLDDNRWLTGGECARADSTFLRRACVTRHFADTPPGERCSLDLDGDGVLSPQTDGLLWTRALLGFRGANLTQTAIGVNAVRKTSAQIEAHLITHCGIR